MIARPCHYRGSTQEELVMKRFLFVGSMLAATALAGVAVYAQRVQSNVQQQIISLDKEYWAAVDACDPERGSRLVSDGVVFTLIPGTVYNKAMLRKDHFGDTPCQHNYEVAPLRVRIYGDTAVTVGNFGYGGVNGRPRGWATYTRVFVKQDGRWQIVAFQHTASKEKRTVDKNGNLV